jgi:hypothetical protein
MQYSLSPIPVSAGLTRRFPGSAFFFGATFKIDEATIFKTGNFAFLNAMTTSPVDSR